MSILKVEDQDKHCVEAVVLKGDTFKFGEEFKSMQRFFAGHVNSTEGEETA